jgi:hypothetical protein
MNQEKVKNTMNDWLHSPPCKFARTYVKSHSFLHLLLST